VAGGMHEPRELTSQATQERHRAVQSLIEELDAIDWYDQRIDATTDVELREILIHNRDEEKEHAAMLLEWIRRHDGCVDEELRHYLFTEGPITGQEDDRSGGDGGGPDAPGGSLGLGGLVS